MIGKRANRKNIKVGMFLQDWEGDILEITSIIGKPPNDYVRVEYHTKLYGSFNEDWIYKNENHGDYRVGKGNHIEYGLAEKKFTIICCKELKCPARKEKSG